VWSKNSCSFQIVIFQQPTQVLFTADWSVERIHFEQTPRHVAGSAGTEETDSGQKKLPDFVRFESILLKNSKIALHDFSGTMHFSPR
jgi:hypothetical protein